MAELSKLPDSASLPSALIASARTGPPWPRSCACPTPPHRAKRRADRSAHKQDRRMLMALYYYVFGSALIPTKSRPYRRTPGHLEVGPIISHSRWLIRSHGEV